MDLHLHPAQAFQLRLGLDVVRLQHRLLLLQYLAARALVYVLFFIIVVAKGAFYPKSQLELIFRGILDNPFSSYFL